jgi:hypothetical protein
MWEKGGNSFYSPGPTGKELALRFILIKSESVASLIVTAV